MRISSLVILAGLIFAVSCTQEQKSTEGKAVVSVTIIPQKYFLEQLAGQMIEINVLVPPGASPATYEPSVAQLSQLDRSDLYVSMGHLGFELSWMDKIRTVNPGMEVMSMSHGIDLIRGKEEEHDDHHGHAHKHAGVDPHIWMSARNAALMLTNTAEALFRLLPEDSVKIATNLTGMLIQMDSLDREIAKILSDSEGNSFMIYHPSLSYFAQDYKLNQLSMELEGKTPSPSHMKKLTDLGREHQISTIFVQMEFDKKNAEILSKETGAEIIGINPLDYDWPGQMIRIAKKLGKAL